MTHRFDDVRIAFAGSAGSDAEEAVFRIDGAESAVGSNVNPGDVVANGPDAVALVFESGDHHGEIGLAARRGERGGHVSNFAGGVFETEDQHVLGHPALRAGDVRSDAQGEAFFAEKSVAAVAGADRPDQAFFGKMQNVATGGIEVAKGVKAGNEIF